MTEPPDPGPPDSAPSPASAFRNVVIRLLIIPLLVYIIWVLEIFLFGSAGGLFTVPAGPALALYTLVACILVGLVAPVFLMRRAFVSGTVTMFQFGFRSLRRTLAATAFSCIVVYGAASLLIPHGPGRIAFAECFLLLLPTGIATVMICWVITGTHIQALIRHGGPLLSIPVGIVVTGILFGLAMTVLVPVQRSPDLLTLYIGTGMLMALFFFAVRDIYATGIIVTGSLVFLFAGSISPAGIPLVLPWIYAVAIATAGVLLGIHRYLSLHFVTIQIPLT
jgi:hypothetical protein